VSKLLANVNPTDLDSSTDGVGIAISPVLMASAPDLETLYGYLSPMSIGPGWAKKTPSIWPQPVRNFLPAQWSYRHAKAALEAAGSLVDLTQSERRNLILLNPVENNSYATARTLVAAYQLIVGGERALSHRHTPNALRLVIDAEPGLYTVVDGVSVPMLPGDVLLTPNWRWHGHGNDSTSSALWIDFLDAPLVQLLEPMFLEIHPDIYEPIVRVDPDSPLRFPWEKTRDRLADAFQTPDAPYATSVALGNPALSTIGLSMMQLDAGVCTAQHRTTSNNIYAVVSGVGESTVDGQLLTWSRGDVFVVPCWRPQYHRSDEGAVLLRVSDDPVQSALGLLRTLEM
jgi:gentisate 1,2-dioxygenase